MSAKLLESFGLPRVSAFARPGLVFNGYDGVDHSFSDKVRAAWRPSTSFAWLTFLAGTAGYERLAQGSGAVVTYLIPSILNNRRQCLVPALKRHELLRRRNGHLVAAERFGFETLQLKVGEQARKSPVDVDRVVVSK